MNRINPINKIVSKGISKMHEEELTYEEKIQKMVKNLLARAEREVPEYGDFKSVYEEFPNTDKSITATDFMLKINKPLTKGSEKMRNLVAVAYDIPHPYKTEQTIVHGTKKEVLDALKSEDLPSKLEKIYKELADHLAEE